MMTSGILFNVLRTLSSDLDYNYNLDLDFNVNDGWCTEFQGVSRMERGSRFCDLRLRSYRQDALVLMAFFLMTFSSIWKVFVSLHSEKNKEE
jgi:hypothetical protein